MKTLSTKRKIVGALAAAIGLAFSGHASAHVYAEADLALSRFTVAFAPTTVNKVDSFSFTLTNTAQVGGTNSAPPSTNCAGTPALNNCNPAGPVLTSTPANVGVVLAAANTSTPTAPGGAGQFANATSIIKTAELVTGTPSSTGQLAQAQVNSLDFGTSGSTINSQTNVTEVFTLSQASNMVIKFDAILNMLVDANQALVTDNANATINFSLVGQQGTGAAGLNWGWTGGTGCTTTTTAGLCGTIAQPFTINQLLTQSGPGTQAINLSSAATVLPDFVLNVDNLLSGSYALTLTSFTNANVQALPVPEPTVMMLLGASILGAGLKWRRKLVA